MRQQRMLGGTKQHTRWDEMEIMDMKVEVFETDACTLHRHINDCFAAIGHIEKPNVDGSKPDANGY